MAEKDSYMRWKDLELQEVDPFLARLTQWEDRRQRLKLILIPSESICPKAVREALASSFTSVYAEGYPPNLMEGASEQELQDVEEHLIRYRRYGDRRFYKGTEYVHFVEALAKARVSRLFATSDCPARSIFANVQPLSGAAANNAVYQALLQPGDTIMGMALAHGGHLTHGSELNRSGRLYRAVPYCVSSRTGRIDYQELRSLAKEHCPKMIVAGFTSYPWAPDWKELREIADEVGAFLLADIAHPAGLVAAGLYPNPVGIAHVVTFTTHKTLCGPRGAVILSTDPSIAQRLDSAVFPGEQGGPHVNKIAAMAVAFAMANREQFRQLQKKIVENAKALANALEAQGVTVFYGGTDTHLLLVDLKGLGRPTGYPLLGEIAARILDLAGLVVNRNSLPGDPSFAQARGIRLGTPWATQRGMGPQEMKEVARLIAFILEEIRPFTYRGSSGALPRGKLPQEVLERARLRVRELLEGVDPGISPLGYPHETSPPESALEKDSSGKSLFIRIQGERAWAFLQEVCTRDLTGLGMGEARESYVLDEQGKLLDRILVLKEGPESFRIYSGLGKILPLATWFRNLSDGYVLFDPEDLLAKVQGPVKVQLENCTDSGFPQHREESTAAPELFQKNPSLIDIHKPYFIGLWALKDHQRPRCFSPWEPPPSPQSLRRTSLYSRHKLLAKKMAPFAGWEMPIWFSSIQEEHGAVRKAAGLFDVSHMGTIEIQGGEGAHFLDLVTTNYVRWLRPGESQYSFLLSPDGAVMDDLLVYRLEKQRYLLVVNAANAEKDFSWLSAVARGEVALDLEGRGVFFGGELSLKYLQDPEAGESALVDLALQGPASRAVLEQMAASLSDRWVLRGLKKGQVAKVNMGGTCLWVARTGYTGEQVGFEIFVHPEKAPQVWDQILESGKPLDVIPAGLGARDSLRIEAGLPLYGFELAGPLGIDPFEASLGQFVKFHKPFFCGRKEMLTKSREVKRRLIRFRLIQKGVRVVRSGDLVLHRRSQQVMGWVTSAAPNSQGIQMGLALVESRFAQPNTPIAILSKERIKDQPLESIGPGQHLALHEEGLILERFPGRDTLAQA